MNRKRRGLTPRLRSRRRIAEQLEPRRVLNADPFTEIEALTGDVVGVDVSDFYDGVGDSTPTLSGDSVGNLFLPESLGLPPLEQSGRFFVVAGEEGASTLRVELEIDGESKEIPIHFDSGYSQRGEGAVTFGNDPLDALRVSRRLAHLGFRTQVGDSLELATEFDSELRRAIGVFNAAATGLPAYQSNAIRRDLINAPEAPRWVELDVAEINQSSDGIFVHTNLDGSPQSERFISNRWQQLYDIPGGTVEYLQDDPTASALVAVQDRLEWRRGSLPGGGAVSGNEETGDHHGGLEIDFETAAGPTTEIPFFATRAINGVDYPVGPGGTLIFLSGSTYLAAAEGDLPIESAVQVRNPASPQGPQSLWENRPVLAATAPFLQDNVSAGYDLGRVRRQIEALLNAKPTESETSFVQTIWHNDPRTWIDPISGDWNGDGMSGPVQFSPNENGVFQVDLVPPVRGGVVEPIEAETLALGAESIANFLGQLETTGSLDQSISWIGSTGGTWLPIEETYRRGVTDAIGDLLTGDTPVTTSQLVEALRSAGGWSDGLNVSVDYAAVTGGRYLTTESDEVRFTTRISGERTVSSAAVDLDEIFADANVHFPESMLVNVTSRVEMELEIGYDPIVGDFFFDLRDLEASIGVDQTDLQFPVHVGVLGTQASQAFVDLDLSWSVETASEHVDSRHRLHGQSLEQGLTVEELVNISVRRNEAIAEMPLAAMLGTFDTAGTDPKLFANDWDLLDEDAGLWLGTEFDTLDPFRNLTADEVLDMLEQTTDFIGDRVGLLGDPVDIPFIKGWTTEGLFAPEATIRLELLNDVTNASNKPNFKTLQELPGLLGERLTTLDYDPATSEFWMDLDLESQAVDLHEPLNLITRHFDPLGGNLLPDHLEMPLMFPKTSHFASSEARTHTDFRFGIEVIHSDGPTQPDHFFVEDSVIRGQVNLDTSNITMTGQYGLLDVQSHSAIGSSDFHVESSGLEGRWRVDQSPTVTVLPGGQANFELRNFKPAGNEFTVDGDDTAYFTWTDLSDLDTRDLIVPEEFVCYQHVEFMDLASAFRGATDKLVEALDHEKVDDELPVIGSKVDEIKVFADRLNQFATQLESAPEVTIGAFEDLIESGIREILDLQSSRGESVDAVLHVSCDQIEIDLNIVDQLIDRTDSIAVDVLGYPLVGGTAQTQSVMTTDLIFGVDISDTDNLRSYIEDDSQSLVTLRSFSDAINGEVRLGPLGVTVAGGRMALDADGLGPSTDPATFLFSVNPGTNGRHYGPDYANFGPTLDITGAAGTQLPLYYPDANSPMGGTDLDDGDPPDGDDDNYPENQVVFLVDDLGQPLSGPGLVEYPPFESLITDLNLLDQLAEGVQQLLGRFGDALGADWGQMRLPLIGDSLGSVADFVDDVEGAIDQQLQSLADQAIFTVRQALYDGFIAAGLQPQDINGSADDGQADGIEDAYDIIARNSDEHIEFEVVLSRIDPELADPIHFDLGLPNLGFEVNADVEVHSELDFTWNLGFGVSENDGFYLLHDDASDEFDASFDVTIPGAMIDAQFGFLKAKARDNPTSPSALNLDTTIDLVDPTPGDDKIRLSELLSPNAWDITYSGDANVNLLLESDFGSDSFPSIESGFRIHWPIFSSDTSEGDLTIEFTDASIDLGGLVSEIVGPILQQAETILKPIRPLIDVILTEIPVLTDFPELVHSLGCNDAGNSIEIADLMSCALSGTPWGLVFDTVLQVDDLTRKLQLTGGSVKYGLGDYQLVGPGTGTDPRHVGFDPSEVNLNLPSIDVGAALDSLLSSTSGSASQTVELLQLGMQNQGGDKGRGLIFPILENPATGFGLLLGQNPTLVMFDLPKLAGKGSLPKIDLQIAGLLSAQLEASYEYAFDVDLGYDTKGLVEFANGGPASSLINGLFLTGHDEAGRDKPEAMLDFNLDVGGGGGINLPVGVKIVEAEARAHIRTEDQSGNRRPLTLNLRGGDSEGKVRFTEMANRLQANGYNPMSLFTAEGRIVGSFEASLWAGFEAQVPDGFETREKCWKVFGKKKCTTYPDLSKPLFKTVRTTLYGEKVWKTDPVTILDLYSLNVGSEEEPNELASKDGNLLRLNVGPRAYERKTIGQDDPTADGAIVDGTERYVISMDADDIIIKFAGLEQRIPASGIQQIVGDFGAAADRLYVDESVSLPVDVSGGDGEDRLEYHGTSTATLRGDGGADIIKGGNQNDILEGGSGTDQIEGRDGNDIIRGGSASDVLRGGKGNDTIDGDSGSDRIEGGQGINTLRGGTGNDEIVGGDDGETIEGGSGDDRIFGNGGGDTIRGDDGEDFINGGEGSDNIDGGDDNDRIEVGT
ncbi:MAG: calcium-binding protein, partial [Planctomycetota bacterium]